MSQNPEIGHTEESRTFGQQAGNVADVTWRTLKETPRAFYDEIAADLTQHTAQVVLNAAKGAVVGAAGTLLLKVPEVAAPLGLLAVGCGVIEAGRSADRFVIQARQADSAAERQTVAGDNARNLGHNLAAMTESAPAMIAGGWGVSKIFGKPALYTRAGDLFEKNISAPARESYAFRGPGTVRLSTALARNTGEFDALSAGRMLAERHPWQGVETGSTIDLAKMRVSRKISGDEDFIAGLPGVQRDGVIPFHTHGPDAAVGYRPSRIDIAATRDLGILQQGKTTTYYVGEARQYATLDQGGHGAWFAPDLRAVAINLEKGVAERLTGHFIPGIDSWQLQRSEQLDFAQTLQVLRRIDPGHAWTQLSEIAAKGKQ